MIIATIKLRNDDVLQDAPCSYLIDLPAEPAALEKVAAIQGSTGWSKYYLRKLGLQIVDCEDAEGSGLPIATYGRLGEYGDLEELNDDMIYIETLSPREKKVLEALLLADFGLQRAVRTLRNNGYTIWYAKTAEAAVKQKMTQANIPADIKQMIMGHMHFRACGRELVNNKKLIPVWVGFLEVENDPFMR